MNKEDPQENRRAPMTLSGELGPLWNLIRRSPRPPVGAAPDQRVSGEGATPTRISFTRYNADGLEEGRVESPEQLAALRREGHVLWLNVEGLSDTKVLEQIGNLFGLHPLALTDVVHVDQRAKTEFYQDHIFFVARMVYGREEVHHEQLSLFLGKGWVITFQERPGDCFDLIRERIRNPSGRFRQRGADYLAYALVDAVVDAYFAPIEAMGERLDTLEGEVISEPNPRVIRQIHALKRELLVLRRAAWPLREAIHNLLREEENPLVEPGVRVFLRDCYDHTIQVMDMLETYRELAASQMELYLSTISQRTNDIMKVLTMFASIFIPLTFIVGIYGMNFDPEVSPWNMPELGWRYGYPAIMLFMATMATGTLLYFKRRKWM